MRPGRQFARYRKVSRLARGWAVTWLLRLRGGTVGRGLEVDAGFTLRWGPHRGVRLGDNVHFGRGVVIDVPHGACLDVGDRVKIMHYTVIAVTEHLTIGRLTQVAEHCSLRDSDHGVSLDQPIGAQSVATPTHIGADVWVARGAAVLRGSHIGDGAVIGANSVAKGKLPPLAIAVGAPAKVVRYRGEVRGDPDRGPDARPDLL